MRMSRCRRSHKGEAAVFKLSQEEAERLDVLNRAHDGVERTCGFRAPPEFLLLRRLVGLRPLHFEEVGTADVHDDDVAYALRRVLGQSPEGAAGLVKRP
jgi:hypothetical protein